MKIVPSLPSIRLWVCKHEKFFDFLKGGIFVFLAWKTVEVGIYGLYLSVGSDIQHAAELFGGLLALMAAKWFWNNAMTNVHKWLKKDIEKKL